MSDFPRLSDICLRSDFSIFGYVYSVYLLDKCRQPENIIVR